MVNKTHRQWNITMRKMFMTLIFENFKTLSPVITSLTQKRPEFVHYVPTVIKRSKSITTQYLRTANISQVSF